MLMVCSLGGGVGCIIDESSKWLLSVVYQKEVVGRIFGKCWQQDGCICLKWYNWVCKPMDNGV